MWQEVKPDESGSYESACHLRNQVRGEPRKVTGGNSKTHRHGRIEMRVVAPASDCREHDMDGLSIRETAKRLGVPHGTVKGRVRRARGHLKQMVEKTLGGERDAI